VCWRSDVIEDWVAPECRIFSAGDELEWL